MISIPASVSLTSYLIHMNLFHILQQSLPQGKNDLFAEHGEDEHLSESHLEASELSIK
jgi:hypothetical protein